MSLNPTGMGGSSWNFSRPDGEGYSLELYGTVVSLQEVQARTYNPGSNQPGAPRFWPDGNPVMNIRVGLATPEGKLKTVTFGKAGKKQISGEKPSLHMQLFNLTNRNMMDLIGKTLHLWTWTVDPETQKPWGPGNPRKFGVELVSDQTYQLAGVLPAEYTVPELLCNDGAQGGAPNPQMIQQPQMPPMQGNFYAPPTAQQFPQSPQYQQYIPQQQPQYQPQSMPQMPPQQMMPQYQQQPTIQQMPPQSAPMPQGMDPAVAAAMQAVGAINVQPADPTGGIYDDDIPFS